LCAEGLRGSLETMRYVPRRGSFEIRYAISRTEGSHGSLVRNLHFVSHRRLARVKFSPARLAVVSLARNCGALKFHFERLLKFLFVDLRRAVLVRTALSQAGRFLL